jgi:hypothetical protein
MHCAGRRIMSVSFVIAGLAAGGGTALAAEEPTARGSQAASEVVTLDQDWCG